MLSRLLPVFLFLFLLASCSQKKGQTETSLKIVGNINSTFAAHSAGGGMIYGKSSTGNHFAKRIGGADNSIILDNGVWTFYGVIWDGDPDKNSSVDAMLSGMARCSYVPNFELSGGEAEVPITFNNSTCGIADFSPNSRDHANGNGIEWPRVEPVACSVDPNTVTDDGSFCNGANDGYFSSYKILLVPHIKDIDGYVVNEQGALATSCYKRTAAGNAYTQSELKAALTSFDHNIPLGNGVDTPFLTIVRGYYGSEDCGVTANGMGHHDYIFKNGIHSGAPKTKNYFSDEGGSYWRTRVYNTVTHGDICSGPRLDPSTASGNMPYAFGSNLTEWKGICTPKQFNSIRELDVALNFMQLRDLDFFPVTKGIGNAVSPCLKLGRGMIPVGGLSDQGGLNNSDCAGLVAINTPSLYTGTYDGKNYSIKNIMLEPENMDTVGLFRHIGTGGVVKNLELHNIMINADYKVGVVAGNNQGVIENVKIFKSSVEANDDGGGISNAGIAVGYNTGTINQVHVINGRLESDGESNGGIAGYSSGTLTHVSVKAIIDNDEEPVTAKSNTGGIVGKAIGGSISKAVSKGMVSGREKNIGGIIGFGDSNVAISEVYSTMNIVNRFFNGGAFSYSTGGLAGNLAGGGSTLNNGFFLGSINVNCPNADATCKIGLFAGQMAATPGPNLKAIAPLDYTVNALGGRDPGSTSTEAEFRSASTLGSFISTIGGATWRHTDGAYPRLSFEGNHACESPDALLSVGLQSANGRGSSANPILVCSDYHLSDIESYPNLNYALKQSIVLRNRMDSSMISNFSGSFNGEGNALFDIKINNTTSGQTGFFKDIVSGGSVYNLRISNAIVESNYGNNSETAVLAGVNNGVIDDVEVFNSKIPSALDNVGLIAGSNFGVIKKARTWHSHLIGANNVGGIVGHNTGLIDKALSHSFIIIPSSASPTNINHIGGVVGRNNGEISQASFYGLLDVIEPGDGRGGIVGGNFGKIKDSYTHGNAKIEAISLSKTGGIAGVNNGATSTIENSINAALILSKGYCTNGSYTDSPSCTGGGGAWTNEDIDFFDAITAENVAGASVSNSFYTSRPYMGGAQNLSLTYDAGSVSPNCRFTGSPTVVDPARYKVASQVDRELGMLDIISISAGDIFIHHPDCSELANDSFIRLKTELNLDRFTVAGNWDANTAAPGIPAVNDLYEVDVAGSTALTNAPGPWAVGDLVAYDNVNAYWIRVPQIRAQRRFGYGSYMNHSEALDINFYSTFDMIEDQEGGIRFNELVNYFSYILQGQQSPSNHPVWIIEPNNELPMHLWLFDIY